MRTENAVPQPEGPVLLIDFPGPMGWAWPLLPLGTWRCVGEAAKALTTREDLAGGGDPKVEDSFQALL